ncbi:MAG: ABC transporter permease, partial [Planctomycetaceae bacterium]|nr:ABC transporter permease [Planctomycetaceae bacterium]
MYKLLLCVRYLRTRYIALASIISVMLGVATMIVVNSVMAGFTSEMRDRIKGVLADVVVEARSMDGIEDSKAQMAVIEEAAGEFIAAMTPTVEVPAMVTYNDPVTGETFTQPIQLIGIDPPGKAEVGPLKSYLDSYNSVVENGREIRGPLRPMDEELGWNLTPAAQSYRQMVKRQQMLYLKDAGVPFSHPSAPPAPDFDSDLPAPNSDNASPAVAAAETGEPVAPPDFDAPPDFNSPMPPATTTDPGAPMSARVFVGEQITGFQARDPETGAVRRVNLVNPGDDIIITTVQSSTPPEPISFSATVVDMFRSGMNEYDSQIVLMNLEELQKNRGMIVEGVDAITAVQIRLHDYKDAPVVVQRLKAAFPPGAVSVNTWEAKQGLLLSAVEVETAILNVLLFM